MQMMFDFEEVAAEDKSAIEGKVITENPELDGLTLDDLAKIIIKETGIQFVKDGDKYVYQNKKFKKNVSFKYGRFSYYDKPLHKGNLHNEKYISCDYSYQLGGCGSPERSIKEAIAFFNRVKERLNKKEEN